MRPPLLARLLSACLPLLACGGAPPPPATAAAAASTAADPPPAVATGTSTPTDDPPEPPALPAACADPSAAVCTPPTDFVDRLCSRPHQDLALWMFAKATPFTRLYLRGKMDELAFDEEVLALRFHPVAKGGIQVGSGSGSYDVLRWDGSCSRAVDADMLSKTRPPRPRTAHLQWHRLGDPMQNALVGGSDAVKRAHAKRGKECQGAMTGDVSSACEKADAALVDAVVEYIRGGAALPAPYPP